MTGATNATFSSIPANNDEITCVLISNEACVVNNPATSNSVIMWVTSYPNLNILQNLNVTGTQCFDAIQTITVAGGGSTFTVDSTGSATMIAGQQINYLPGTLVKSGGYLLGYITTSSQYCGSQTPSIAANIEDKGINEVSVVKSPVKVYPNPTSGAFVFECFNSVPVETIMVNIYNITGEKILSTVLSGGRKHDLSLSGQPAGIYLVQVVSGKNPGTTRIIKR